MKTVSYFSAREIPPAHLIHLIGEHRKQHFRRDQLKVFERGHPANFVNKSARMNACFCQCVYRL